MDLSPEDFVRKEFAELEDMSQADWLRKMKEYETLSTSKVDIEYLLDLPKNQKDALVAAISALYFSDSADYRNYLFVVVRHLTNISLDDFNDDLVKSIFNLFKQE